MIDQARIDELVSLRSDARQSAENYSEAIKNVADTADIRPAALRKYINAREADKLGDLDTEAAHLANLLEQSTHE